MMRVKLRKIGLTGNMGSGKSTVAKIFAHAGVPILSADAISREICEPGSEAHNEIVAAFGKSILNKNQSLNRSALRELITADSNARKTLEKILHPKIQKKSFEKMEELFSQGNELVIYEAPLLFEAKSEHQMDAIICVTAPREHCIQRVMRRDNSSLEDASKLFDAQMSQEEKAKRSQFIIKNDKDLKNLENEVARVLQEIYSSQKS